MPQIHPFVIPAKAPVLFKSETIEYKTQYFSVPVLSTSTRVDTNRNARGAGIQ